MMGRLRILACAVLLCAGNAAAALIEFSFSGRVTDDAINGCGGLVACGVLSGRYRFDSAAADGNAAASEGLYAASSISLSIDGSPFFAATDGVITIADNTSLDHYGLLAIAGGAANGSAADLSITLQDGTGVAFGSDALPLLPSALTALLPGTFALFAADDSFQLQGAIDSIACNRGCGNEPVPEPATALLLAAGLAAAGLAGRRSRA